MKISLLLISLAMVCGGASVCVCASELAGSQPGVKTGYDSIRVSTSGAEGEPRKPIRVRIDFAGLPASGAAITYTTEGGLALESAAQTRLSADSRGSAQDTVTVQAGTAGVYFLNVFAHVPGGSKAASIPVTVGNAVYTPRPAPGKSAVGTDGQRVLEMPAQETRD
ncbi:hypothetical protein AWB79_00768 [Caballeronia hypogeia]|uniref:Lipoprotein n=1 Tax=Caballeronia hypogeia TaxID=1777140 RepID=A0A157ZEW3_9BURK|nr:hypothetical protein [Caballeronia hypogeia]SAK44064.1 hypothetical protein AWB79_00768 [Caballeronia hypogeia]